MKLLFDENLSPVLPAAPADCYGESQHVRDVGLKASPGADVWADFRQWSFLHGHPPKVIWIGLGNCSTRAVEPLLRRRIAEVTEFFADNLKAFLVLS